MTSGPTLGPWMTFRQVPTGMLLKVRVSEIESVANQIPGENIAPGVLRTMSGQVYLIDATVEVFERALEELAVKLKERSIFG